MKKVFFRLHYVDIAKELSLSESELVYTGTPRKVLNLGFILSVAFFMICVILKANIAEAWAAIPLGISAFALFSRVWVLSENAKVVFDKNDHSLYRVYKHLGYLQVVYSTPFQSIINAECICLHNKVQLVLRLDNLESMVISNQPIRKQSELKQFADTINKFIAA